MILISHRGCDNHNYSENSLLALITSLNKEYIDGVEFDVRITKDHKLVLIHDPVIDFISDGNGIVKYMNLEQLRLYKYGKSKESISTLDEFLQSINTNKIILIELKELGNDYTSLVDETVKIINKYKLNIYISSFNYLLINYLKNNYPSVKCGVIVAFGLNMLKLKNSFDFNEINYSYKNLIDRSKETFTFLISKKDMDNYKDNFYVITDNSYKYINHHSK